MSLLEFVGLEYLLGDNDPLGFDDIAEHPFGLIFILIGIPAWIILSIVDARYMDKAGAVWNLLPAVVLLVLLIIRVITSILKHVERKKVYFNIINLIVVIGFFIYGLSHPYLSLFFEHEYYPFWSGIAFTLWPNIIFLMIYEMFFNTYNSDLKSKILVVPIGIGSVILAFLATTFIGQTFSTIFYFTGHKDFYNHFAYYHKIVYNDIRKEHNITSIEDFLNERYKKVDEFYDKRCNEEYSNLSGEEFENNCRKLQEGSLGNYYIENLNSTTKKDYGYYISRFYHIGDSYQDVICVIDKEWNKPHYYILDRNNYSVKKTTKKYYDEIKQQNTQSQ